VKPKFARVVEHIKILLDIFLYLNRPRDGLVAVYGASVILFLICFSEPRLFVTPAARCP